MKKSMIAIAILMSLTSFAHAAAEECDGSTQDMQQCLLKKLDKADKQLNATYAATLAAVKQVDANTDSVVQTSPHEVQDRLVKAERAWIQFRDASCDLEAAQMLGGSGSGLIQIGCVLGKTQERTKELAEITKMFSGF